MKYILSLLLLLLLFSGCEPIEEESDTTINTDFKPNAVNTCNLNDESTLGCFGADLEFGDNETLVEGTWSLYAKRDRNLMYYNTYLFGYQFSGNGFAQPLNKKQEYYTLAWGIDRDGTKITVEHEGTLTYVGIFGSDTSCYKVKHSAFGNEELKLCHDQDITGETNNLGIYSANVKFGNYTYGNYPVVGTWNISEYGVKDAKISTHILDANGTVRAGGEWGLSRDGKVLHINDSAYLVNEYLDNNCLVCLNINGNLMTPLKLCKAAP
ncbi:MAG: hypothetical protein DSZ03_03485 [Sulfurimonas sp.]|nr:MAG: hypothetical protein DSZ03_03485 [Sulfurimonas sp.]